jgi:hypothetical protein
MATNGTRNGEAAGPPAEVREALRKAARIATHAQADGDPRGAWEAYHCGLRLVLAGHPQAEQVCDRLRAALEAAADATFDEQLPLLLQACEEFAGPLDAGAAPGDDEDPLAEIRAWISFAISLGAPAYNQGDQRGCYEVYAAVARLLVRAVNGADDARGRLEVALRRCAASNNVDEQAWTMRRAFDAVLAPPAVEGTDEMRGLLAMAIQIGAPAYNTGDRRGCYEIYAATARLIVTAFTGGEEAKQRLREALSRCEKLDDANEQAWTMRRAFDSILAGAADAEGEGEEEPEEGEDEDDWI